MKEDGGRERKLVACEAVISIVKVLREAAACGEGKRESDGRSEQKVSLDHKSSSITLYFSFISYLLSS